MVVIQAYPGDTYNIAEVQDSRGHRYATRAHISMLKQFGNITENEDSDTVVEEDQPTVSDPNIEIPIDDDNQTEEVQTSTT